MCNKNLSGNFKKDRKFCNRSCYLSYAGSSLRKKRGVFKNCEACNKKFYVSPCNIKKTKFCNLECRRLVYKNSRPTRRKGTTKKCEWCGSKYYVCKSRLSSKFCSKKCLNQWQGRNKHTCICKICDKNYKVSPSLKNSIYCSVSCRDKDIDKINQLIYLNKKQQENKNSNKLEKQGYFLLDSLGIVYLPQHLMFGKFLVDAFVVSHNTVIQFDGDYWHGNPQKFRILTKRQEYRRNLDVSQDLYMKKCGISVIRLWESEIYNEENKIRDYLLRLIPKHRNHVN